MYSSFFTLVIVMSHEKVLNLYRKINIKRVNN